MRFFDRRDSRFPLTSVTDYQQMAQKRLPTLLFDFLEGGAFEEVTLRQNREDFDRIQLKRRVLKDVANINTEVEILGQKIDMPLILSPVGFAGAYAKRGEVQAAKAAAQANIPFSLSTVGICSMEEVASRSSRPFWFQFYLFKDRQHTLDILQRAAAVHCPVLLLTVDLPVAGARYRYQRSRKKGAFSHFLDMLAHFRWWQDVYLRGRPLSMGNAPSSAPHFPDLPRMRQWMGTQLNVSCTWKDFEWVRTQWKGKLIVKGVLDPEDAVKAYQTGADGIVVSNHGARHLDGTLSTIEALPPIADLVKGRLHILADGGIASGLDIVKAIASGADGCMIGRSWMYGLAARGEEGVSEVISLLKNELKIVMAHLGVNSVSGITTDLLIRTNG
jgi:L-lactate dehydrogenase (cytochrome)